MKSLSEWLSKMAFLMSGQPTKTCQASGRSTNSVLEASERPCTQLLSAYDLDSNFIKSMGEYLTVTLAKARVELQAAEYQRQIAETQAAMLTTAQLPHRLYGAYLTHDGLEYIAKNIQDEYNQPACVGRGASPAEALTNFDYQWYGIEKKEEK